MNATDTLPPGERADDELHAVDALAAIDDAFKRRLANPPVHERLGCLELKAEHIDGFVYVDATFRAWGVPGSIKLRFSARTFLRVRHVFDGVDV
jgi:hypothetical protein